MIYKKNYYYIVNNNYNKSIILANNIKKYLINNYNDYFIENKINPKFIFIIGGDGTLLRILKKYQKNISNIFFIFIRSENSLGFYSSYNEKNYKYIIKKILNNNFFIKKLSLLEINYNKNKISYCLNEVKIIDYINTIKINIFINNNFLEYFCGSGLIFSTSTGSSGYVKTIGGSIIVSNNYNLWQMKEIAPVNNHYFSTINNSLIFDDKQIIVINGELNNKKIIIDIFEYNLFYKIIKIKISKKKLNIICEKEELNNFILKRLKLLY